MPIAPPGRLAGADRAIDMLAAGGGARRPRGRGLRAALDPFAFTQAALRARETWEKLPFYAAHRVEELLIIDPDKHTVQWLAPAGGEYRPIERSLLIELGPGELDERIDWPA